eukprot:8636074-Lingulodinium_polyedra.AAC.1
MKRANVRYANRCDGRRSTRPHRCVTFENAAQDAGESTARRRDGSQITRSRTPRARQQTGARMECASVRFAAGGQLELLKCCL